MLAHLEYPLTDRLHVAQTAQQRLAQTHIKALPCHTIFQAIEPCRKFVSAFDRKHVYVVIYRLHLVKQPDSASVAQYPIKQRETTHKDGRRPLDSTGKKKRECLSGWIGPRRVVDDRRRPFCYHDISLAFMSALHICLLYTSRCV